MDQNKRVRLVPPSTLSVPEARKEIVRHCFRNFGLFTAENLARFIRYELPMKELRSTLAELERDGFLVKGFLVDGDENVHWAMREDLGRIGKVKTTETVRARSRGRPPHLSGGEDTAGPGRAATSPW